jgi:hypothetical protein
MPERQTQPQSDLDIGVEKETIDSFEGQLDNRGDLYPSLKQTDEELAMYIRRQAIKRFPDDLQAREGAVELALEVAYLDRSQLTINGLQQRLFSDEALTVEDLVRAELPPAA